MFIFKKNEKTYPAPAGFPVPLLCVSFCRSMRALPVGRFNTNAPTELSSGKCVPDPAIICCHIVVFPSGTCPRRTVFAVFAVITRAIFVDRLFTGGGAVCYTEAIKKEGSDAYGAERQMSEMRRHPRDADR